MLAGVSTPEGPKAVFSVTEQDKEQEEYRILGVRMYYVLLSDVL